MQPSTDDEISNISWVINDRLLYTLAEKPLFFDQPVPTGELYAIKQVGHPFAWPRWYVV